jgi:hypothetical protein
LSTSSVAILTAPTKSSIRPTMPKPPIIMVISIFLSSTRKESTSGVPQGRVLSGPANFYGASGVPGLQALSGTGFSLYRSSALREYLRTR